MKFTNGRFYMVNAESSKYCGSVNLNSYNKDESLEADNKMRVARELLMRSLEMLYLLGYDSSFTNPAIDTLTNDIKDFLEETA